MRKSMKLDWKTCFRVGVSVFLLYLCMTYWETVATWLGILIGATMPILIGLTIAYVLNLLMSFYELHYFPKKATKKSVQKTRRPLCMVAAILSLCGIIALVVWLVIPELFLCIRFLIAEIPPALDRMAKSELVQKILPEEILSKLLTVNWQEHITTIFQFLTSGLGNTVNTIVSLVTSMFSAIVTSFISIIFAIYLLLDRDKLTKQCNRLMSTYLNAKWDQKIHHGLTVLNECFRRYIVGQCIEAIILGALCILGMMIFQFPYAIMIGTLIGFTALIPVAGAYIGAGVGAVMIMTVSPVKALLFLVFILVLQQLEGNIIYPKVVGNSLGLPPLWVLAAVTVGGSLMGIIGMLIGVPIAAAAYRLLREDVHRRNGEPLPEEGKK